MYKMKLKTEIKIVGMILLIMLGLTIFASAEINNYAPIKINECVTIKQTCASCSYVNFSLSYPNSSIALNNQQMINQGGGVWIYEFCNTSQQGRWDINGIGDPSSVPTTFDVLYFNVNEYGIESWLFALYTLFYLSLLITSYIFIYKFATFNGSKVRDANFYFWASFLDLILFVIIEINGFGGVDTLIVDIIKIVSFASGIYFLYEGIINTFYSKK